MDGMPLKTPAWYVLMQTLALSWGHPCHSHLGPLEWCLSLVWAWYELQSISWYERFNTFLVSSDTPLSFAYEEEKPYKASKSFVVMQDRIIANCHAKTASQKEAELSGHWAKCTTFATNHWRGPNLRCESGESVNHCWCCAWLHDSHHCFTMNIYESSKAGMVLLLSWKCYSGVC